MGFIAVDYNKCVNCKNCMYACAFHYGNTCETKFSAISVNLYPEEYLCIPSSCKNCHEAWCLNICPKGAISRDLETGEIKLEQKNCAGCKMCLMACPFGNMHFDSSKGKAFKCDLCGGNPQCVRHCISGSLSYVEDEDFSWQKMHSFNKKFRTLLKSNKAMTGGCSDE